MSPKEVKDTFRFARDSLTLAESLAKEGKFESAMLQIENSRKDIEKLHYYIWREHHVSGAVGK